MTTPIDLPSITATHWQPRLGTIGEIVEGLRDIDQAIRIILLTPLGSDPHRQLFGSRLFDYLDWPVDQARPHLVRESIEAIRKWEARADVVRVRVSIDGERIVIAVQWRVADGVIQRTEVMYGNTAAA